MPEQRTRSTPLNCPRCAGMLLEHEPNKNWLRWFECARCESAWHFIGANLHAGRLRSPLYGTGDSSL
jgi:hypothetical protein